MKVCAGKVCAEDTKKTVYSFESTSHSRNPKKRIKEIIRDRQTEVEETSGKIDEVIYPILSLIKKEPVYVYIRRH